MQDLFTSGFLFKKTQLLAGMGDQSPVAGKEGERCQVLLKILLETLILHQAFKNG